MAIRKLEHTDFKTLLAAVVLFRPFLIEKCNFDELLLLKYTAWILFLLLYILPNFCVPNDGTCVFVACLNNARSDFGDCFS